MKMICGMILYSGCVVMFFVDFNYCKYDLSLEFYFKNIYLYNLDNNLKFRIKMKMIFDMIL